MHVKTLYQILNIQFQPIHCVLKLVSARVCILSIGIDLKNTFSNVLPSLWYHIILSLLYDYLKLVHVKMSCACIRYMMLFLKSNN